MNGLTARRVDDVEIRTLIRGQILRLNLGRKPVHAGTRNRAFAYIPKADVLRAQEPHLQTMISRDPYGRLLIQGPFERPAQGCIFETRVPQQLITVDAWFP